MSILDQILLNQKAEEVSRLNAVELINGLFSELNDREKDILVRRFGLHGKDKETLEYIGKVHNLTRERIRQIETSSVKRLQQLDVLEKHLGSLKKVIVSILEEHGGLMEKDYLLSVLVFFSLNSGRSDVNDQEIHKRYLNFLIAKLLNNEFEESVTSREILPSYKLKYQNIKHFDEIISALVEVLEEKDNIHKTSDVLGFIKELDEFEKHKEHVNTENNIDISGALYSEYFNEDYDLLNEHKVLYSVLKVAKKIDQNKFGHWGLKRSRAINPKTINDKIYLIMRHTGKPMHFVEIADKINEVKFDAKIANPATVHNELILDKKYVLIGRGIYSLKEWGYKSGTVADVIREVLTEADTGLSREDVISRVLEKRMVKKTTIILSLMNRENFKRVDNKYYLLES